MKEVFPGKAVAGSAGDCDCFCECWCLCDCFNQTEFMWWAELPAQQDGISLYYWYADRGAWHMP